MAEQLTLPPLDEKPSSPVEIPPSLKNVTGTMDPDGARRVLRQAIEDGDAIEDQEAAREMKAFLRENPIRL